MAYLDEMNRLKTLQKQQAMSSLGTARDASLQQLGNAKDKSLQTLNTEKTGIGKDFYNQRNVQTASTDLAKKNFAEYSAARGTSNGTANQAELLNNNAFQTNIGGLNVAQGEANVDVNRRIGNTNTDYTQQVANTNTGYNNGLQSAYGGIETAYSQQVAEYRKQQQQALEQRAYETQQQLLAYNQQQAQIKQQQGYQTQQATTAYNRQARQNSLNRASSSRSSGGSRSSGTGPNGGLTSTQYNTEYNSASRQMIAATRQGQGKAWIEANADNLKSLQLTSNDGKSKNAYDQMLKSYNSKNSNDGSRLSSIDAHYRSINNKAIRNMR